MPKKAESKKPMIIGVGALIVGAIVSIIVLFYGGILTGGTDSSHMESIDYSNYGWYLVGIIALLVLTLPLSLYFVKKAKSGNRLATGIVLFATLVLLVGTIFYVGFYVRSYHDSAQVSDITLQSNAGVESATLDLGNATILSASIEEYHDKDGSIYDKLRLLTFDDEWRITIRYNNTAYWNETGQNLTSVTARIKGYALPKAGSIEYRDVTAWISPVTQPGDVDYGDITVLVFEDIERDPRIIYFVGEILDSDSTVLGEYYIHPNIEMAQINWYMDQAI